MKRHYICSWFFFAFLSMGGRMEAQSGLRISLRAGAETSVSIWQNEPLVLSVTLSNARAQSSRLWNVSADRRIMELEEWVKLGRVTREKADSEKAEIGRYKKEITPVTVGGAARPWTADLNWELRRVDNSVSINVVPSLLPNPPASAEVSLDGSRQATASYGLSPGQVATLSPGIYRVRLRYKDGSDSVTLTVRSGRVAEEKADDSLLLRFGFYYWQAGNAGETMKYAQLILARDAGSIDGLSLKGDALSMEEKWSEALQAYNGAYAQYLNKYGKGAEPPEYLMMMISLCREKLGQVME